MIIRARRNERAKQFSDEIMSYQTLTHYFTNPIVTLLYIYVQVYV